MSTTALAVVGYAGWTLGLLGGIAALRGGLTVSGRRAANAFAVTGEDVSAFSARLCRAHANCYENLPVFAALCLVALVTSHAAVTDPLAPWAVASRIAQSVTHLTSTSVRAVQLRFGFFLVQFVIQIVWVVRLASSL